MTERLLVRYAEQREQRVVDEDRAQTELEAISIENQRPTDEKRELLQKAEAADVERQRLETRRRELLLRAHRDNDAAAVDELRAIPSAIAEAEQLAREAFELAQPTDFPDLQATAALALAEARLAAGHQSEAERLVRRAQEIHERKGNVVAARAAGSLFATYAR
jgi:hypothetical protein